MYSDVILSVMLAAIVTPAPADRANIALSTAIVHRVGDTLWPSWSNTPFDIELLTGNGAIAINIPKPIAAPSFPPQLEATFPLSNGRSTIVIGEPRFAAAKTPVRWSVTLLHEHFHQYQYDWKGYLPAIAHLGLAPKSSNGMWMLTYPFPYKRPGVVRTYTSMAHALAGAIDARGTSLFRGRAAAYLAARSAFVRGLSAKDYRYFAFACWQEGTARYTELSIARLAAREHARDAGFLTRAQARALSKDGDDTFRAIYEELREPAFSQNERRDFYGLGAGEALLLDRLAPHWREHYLDPTMDLSIFFPNSGHSR